MAENMPHSSRAFALERAESIIELQGARKQGQELLSDVLLFNFKYAFEQQIKAQQLPLVEKITPLAVSIIEGLVGVVAGFNRKICLAKASFGKIPLRISKKQAILYVNRQVFLFAVWQQHHAGEHPFGRLPARRLPHQIEDFEFLARP